MHLTGRQKDRKSFKTFIGSSFLQGIDAPNQALSIQLAFLSHHCVHDISYLLKSIKDHTQESSKLSTHCPYSLPNIVNVGAADERSTTDILMPVENIFLGPSNVSTAKFMRRILIENKVSVGCYATQLAALWPKQSHPCF